MDNFLKELEIKNFKSIKSLQTDCKRVNVFIGKPNVGKSNILEALGLLGAEYSSDNKFLSEFIRYEEISNLFYDDDLLNNIEVNTNIGRAILRFHSNNINQGDLIVGQGDWISQFLEIKGTINEIGKQFQKLRPNDPVILDSYFNSFDQIRSSLSIRKEGLILNPIKKFHFKDITTFPNKFPNFLMPPHGPNLFSIVDHNKELRKEIAEIFSEYGLNFVAYKKENKFEIEKNIDGYVSKYHYSSIADTFRRLIFYYAAIDSNQNSVLILEEPEVHSFPPHTKDLSERIINSTSNQFFITTHSPYLLQNLISSLDSTELNVFITYFENYETKIKKLSDDELRKASGFSVDLFYNLNQFVPNA
jgi:AAA15 family ATPase/GTPase